MRLKELIELFQLGQLPGKCARMIVQELPTDSSNHAIAVENTLNVSTGKTFYYNHSDF